MGNLETLKTKYPTFPIKSEPSPTCQHCKGNGEYFSKRKTWQPCLCTCITRLPGEGNEMVDLAAAVLHKTLPAKLREEKH